MKRLAVILFLSAASACSTNISHNGDQNSSVKFISNSNKFSYIDIEEIQDHKFSQFVKRFNQIGLPLELRAIGNDGYDYNNPGKEIDTSMVRSFICKGDKQCCYEDTGGILSYYYVYSLPVKGKYVSLIYYQPFSNGHHYFLKNYTLNGKAISEVEISGIVGDVYELDGLITEELQVKTKKINFVFPPNEMKPKEYKAITDQEIYQIKEDGTIVLISRAKPEEKIIQNK